MTGDQAERILKELEMLRKIKMIELIDRGYSQAKLGAALGISQSSISRMMAGKSKTTKGSVDD